MTDSPRNKNIAALITSMYDAAAKFVSQSRAAGSLFVPQICTPGSLVDHFRDFPGENSAGSNKGRFAAMSGLNSATNEVRALLVLDSRIDLTIQERRTMYSLREISERGREVSDIVNDTRGMNGKRGVQSGPVLLC